MNSHPHLRSLSSSYASQPFVNLRSPPSTSFFLSLLCSKNIPFALLLKHSLTKTVQTKELRKLIPEADCNDDEFVGVQKRFDNEYRRRAVKRVGGKTLGKVCQKLIHSALIPPFIFTLLPYSLSTLFI